jgi:hypothetical protein
LLRREFPELERSLIQDAYAFFGDNSCYNQSKHVWNVDDKVIEFGHMEHVGTFQAQKDEAKYASSQYDMIAFDQLEQFPEYAYNFMITRARTSVDSGYHAQVISTANPIGEGVEWIMRHWGPWLDKTHSHPAEPGEIRYFKRNAIGEEVETNADDPDGNSRTYFPASLKDNPYLGDEYRRRLMLMPEPMRSALMNGDWAAMLTDDAYQVIPRAWVKAAMARWTPERPGAYTAVGADISRGGEDQTVFAPKSGDWFDRLVRYPGAMVRDGQAVRDLLIQNGFNTTQVNMDVIGIGAAAYDLTKETMKVNPVNFAAHSDATDRSGQIRFVNVRAQCYWEMRDALDPTNGRNVALPPDSELEGDLVAARWKQQSNGIIIRDKDEIKVAIGRSPDCGDAVVLANHSGLMPTNDEWISAIRSRIPN